MSKSQVLFFEGSRWSAVKVTGRSRGCPQVSLANPAAAPVAYAKFELTASGRGRPWRTGRPLQFWRNFSEIDLAGKNAEAQVLAFLKRHGDPFGALERKALAREPIRTETASWIPTIAWLGAAARAWDEPDADGISRRTDDADRINAATQAWVNIAPQRDHGAEIEVVYSPLGRPGIGLRALNLRAFMVASAALALEEGVEMKRCAQCNDWFELKRSDGRFCTNVCQVTQYQARRQAGAKSG
jgi:hypothetical protein